MIKREHFFLFVFYFCIVVIEYLATTSLEIKPIQNSWDKANHFIAFFTLYILLSFAHLSMSLQSKIYILLAFAIQIEIVQAFLPHREFSFLDIFADAVGIVLGILFMKIIEKFIVKE